MTIQAAERGLTLDPEQLEQAQELLRGVGKITVQGPPGSIGGVAAELLGYNPRQIVHVDSGLAVFKASQAEGSAGLIPLSTPDGEPLGDIDGLPHEDVLAKANRDVTVLAVPTERSLISYYPKGRERIGGLSVYAAADVLTEVGPSLRELGVHQHPYPGSADTAATALADRHNRIPGNSLVIASPQLAEDRGMHVVIDHISPTPAQENLTRVAVVVRPQS